MDESAADFKPAAFADTGRPGGIRTGVQSIELIRDNLRSSARRVLDRVEEMRDHALVFPTPHGGCHTLWVLGHLAYIEAQVTDHFIHGGVNALAQWETPFDGADVSGEPSRYPPFDEVLGTCRQRRALTIELAESLSEADLDNASTVVPRGFADTFGTLRQCLQYLSDHWYMHRGHLADARRAAGVGRIWV
jgi:hypothetical protein